MPRLPSFVLTLPVGLALVALLALPTALYAQGRPAMVGLETVEMRTLSETVPVFAEVVTTRDAVIAARVGGVIDGVSVLVGDTVEAGMDLATIDTELLDIQVAQAEARMSEGDAGLRVARARLERATDAFERIDGLRGTSAFSAGRFDEARGTRAEALGQLAEAEARVASARAGEAEALYQRDRARIEAPYAGIVLEVMVSPGEFVSSGAPVVRLLDTATLEVEAAVPTRYAVSLSPGVSVTGRTDEGRVLDLTVRAILPVEDARTRTRPVRFVVQDFGGSGAVGQSLTVDIPVGAPRDVLSVPKDALVQARGGWTVYVDAEGAAQPRMVEVGEALGDRFEVLSGLTDGDVVVVRGNERLRPGQQIMAMGQGGGGRRASN